MKIAVMWDVTSYNLVVRYLRFVGTYFRDLVSWRWKLETTKCLHLSTKLHGIASQKTAFFTFIA